MKRLLISVTCMLYAAMELHLVVGATNLPNTFPYTLQATPIAFTEEPKSQSVLQGTNVSLSCNTTILQNNNYRLPELMWRFNGQLLNDDQSSHIQIRNHPSNTWSKLTILGVSQEDNGYYECVARDGYHSLNDGEASYFYVITSQRAQLKVIAVDLHVSEEVEAVSVSLGEHLLLPCETGAVNPPTQSTWRKDGIEVTENINEVVLGNGSLLILGAVEETEGNYQCTGYYNHEPLNSTTYNVSLSHVSQGVSAGGSSPVVIVDGPAGIIEVGEWLNLTCYISNSEGLRLQWLKDGQILPAREKLLALRASVQDSGTYSCQLVNVSSSVVLATSDFNVIIANEPVVELRGCVKGELEQPCGDDAVKPENYFERTITLACSTSDPLATIHWYKNGQNITSYSSGNTLRYTGVNSDYDLGVYQCFAETPAGTSYDTVRIIRKGFTNPPGKFKCQVVDQSSNISQPSVILSWERPTLQAFSVSSDGFAMPPEGGSYVIIYEPNAANLSRTVAAETTTALIDLPMDDQYTFKIYFDHNDKRFTKTAISECKNNTFIRRTSVPRRLTVSCPESIPSDDQDNTNVTIPVQWISPLKSPVVTMIVPIFSSFCLQNNNIQKNDLLTGVYLGEDDKTFNFEVGPLLPGTVCLFGGHYQLFGTGHSELFVPSESCGIPVPQSTGKAQLRLTCSNSVAAVEVVSLDGDAILNSTNITGLCVSIDWGEAGSTPPTKYNLAPGNSSISDLPDDTLCSFYGSYQLQSAEVVDFEPVHCIMNRPPPTIPVPPTTTEDTTATSTSASESDTTGSVSQDKLTTTDAPDIFTPGEGSGFSVSPAALTWVAVDLSLALLVIIVLVIACFAWKSYSRKRIKEQKSRLHIWDDFLTQQEGEDNLDQDPHVLPQFPYASHAPDSLSIATEVDYLYKEEGRTLLNHTSLSSLMKSMKNDEKAIDSPKLIMDRFLNGCHQRVWESSHESLSNVPPSSTQEQGTSKLTELHCTETVSPCDGTDPTSSQLHLATDSDNVTAQHYTLPLQTGCLAVDSYIPSGGSSGYGTCSDHYFESGSSTYTSATNDYFKSRLADVAECNSLSTCGEEEERQQTSVVDIRKHSGDSCHEPTLACEVSPCNGTDKDRPHRTLNLMTLPIKSTGNHSFVTTQCAGHTNSYTNSDLINRQRDFTPSSIPPEHYFTDDEGYLRFAKETTV